MKLLKNICFSFLIFVTIQGKAQIFQIDSINACIGDTAIIPIHIPAIDSVGAITLFISYDTTKLDFINLTNINPLASGILYNDMHAGIGGPRLGKIAISWVANGPGANYTAGIFATMNYKVLSGSCPINFLNNCEIVNYNAQTLSVNFSNGYILVPSLPIITNQPTQLSLNSSQSGVYIINATNSQHFQWQINQGNGWINLQNNTTFQGFNKDSLFVYHPDLALNGSYFRCLLSNFCFLTQSDSVSLNVSGLFVESNKISNYKISPNPFSDFLTIDFYSQNFIIEIKLFQIDGKLTKHIDINKQSSSLKITQFNEIENGIYFLEILSINSDNLPTRNTIKLIKN